MLAKCGKEIMLLDYADVLDLLDGTWYANEGAEAAMCCYEVTPDHITYENANAGSPLARLAVGKYFYYGPVTLGCDLSNGIVDLRYGKNSDGTAEISMSGIRFNIIDGQPTLFYESNQLESIDKLSDHAGYTFLPD